VQHVIDAVVIASFFDGSDVGGLFHDANQPLIAGRVRAIGAGIDVGYVVADGTKMQAGLELADGICELLGVFITGSQNVKGEALRRLAANAGELL